ncbi:hypothetical protein [Haloarcula halophila]|uniref:hypothetical protein n=1 Tax=Haloarcula TaxID=2237 RepID=UPI0023E42480|nr:hypothetical protein [Halomicroarcula sp. DFY41]
MSLQEGPQAAEQAAYDDGSEDQPPTGLSVPGLGVLRDHFENWAERYVEMRVQARTGRWR